MAEVIDLAIVRGGLSSEGVARKTGDARQVVDAWRKGARSFPLHKLLSMHNATATRVVLDLLAILEARRTQLVVDAPTEVTAEPALPPASPATNR